MFKRTLSLPCAIGAALLLGACGGTVNRGLESVHQPVVTRTDYALDVATSGNALAPGEAQRLAGWMESLRLGYGDQVSVDDPTPGSAGVRADVEGQIARYGLLISDNVPVTASPVTPGTARVIVTRMRATVPGCPDFSRINQPEFNSNTTSNQGCAINANLAAMVARPQDLVRGQPGADVADPAAATKAIDVFRKAVPSGSGGLKSAGN